MLYVYKFGGTSISDASRIKHVAKIATDKRKKIVVCSALDGVTEKLIHLAELASRGRETDVTHLIGEVNSLHSTLLDGAIASKEAREEASKRIKEVVEHLTVISTACARVREVTPKERDAILSCGEMLSSPILSAAITERGADSLYMTGGEAGIVTDDNFGDAVPIFEMTYHNIKRKVLPLVESGKIPVVAGYTAKTQHGDISTLGRGGSDYTATLIGAAVRAEEVILWSDVDGLMTADPRIVNEARVIDEVSYAEAREMAMFGAKSMHPRCLDPAEEFGIKVRFKNTFKPEGSGTLVKKSAKISGAVRAVLLVRDASAITVKGTSMVGKPGSAASIFNQVAKTGTNIMMISQSVSESNISFVVRRDGARRAARALERTMLSSGELASISVEDDISVVATIGENMKGTPGIAAILFRALADRGINVKMIAQGSSEMNISIVVDEIDGIEAVRAIHKAFGLDLL